MNIKHREARMSIRSLSQDIERIHVKMTSSRCNYLSDIDDISTKYPS